MMNPLSPLKAAPPMDRRAKSQPQDLAERVENDLFAMHVTLDQKVSWISVFPAIFVAIWALQSERLLLAIVSIVTLLVVMSLSIVVLPRILRSVSVNRGKKLGALTLTDFLVGAFWGAAMLPVAPDIGTNVQASFVCMFIIVTITLSAVTCCANERALLALLSGFALTLIPQTVFFIERLGPIPLIATLLLIPALLLIGHVFHNQVRSMVQTRVENEYLSNELATALRKAKYLAERDSLTGLLNRRAFESRAHDVLTARAGESACAVILLDLDHFKQVNDVHGHAIGDEVLKHTASLIEQRLWALGPDASEKHAAARWGGEEFIILLTELSLGEAGDIAESIRAALHAERASTYPVDLHPSGSFGVATWTQSQDLNEAVNNADEAMYSAKVAGRDRTYLYQPGKSIAAPALRADEMIALPARSKQRLLG